MRGNYDSTTNGSNYGTFTVTGSTAAVTSALDGLVYTPIVATLLPNISGGGTLVVTVVDGSGAQANGVIGISISITETQIGSGVDVLGEDEADNFYVASSGQLAVDYPAPRTFVGTYLPITQNGAAYIPSADSLVYGTGLNFSGQGGHDIFLQAPSGAITAAEINSSGAVLASTALTASGSNFTLSASGSIIGTGTNLWGAGGTDIFFRNSINATTAYEFNTSGVETASHALTAQGNPFSLDAQSTIVGNGLNIWGTGNRDIFVRTATGGLTAWEFDPNGAAQVAHTLDIGIDPFIIDNATTVVGSGFNFWGSGNADMFLRGGNGNISAWEFNYVGVATVGQNLMASAGVSFTLDAASTIVGTGLDFLGTTYEDIFVRSGSGQLSVDEFSPVALETASAALTNADGSAFTIDSASAVIGTGIDVLGTGNHDLFVANAAGDVSVDEFNSSGALTASATLTQGGGALVLPLASTVIGSGFNFLGDGDADIFVRSPNNSITAMELTAAGAVVASVELMVGSSPFQLDGSSTIIGTGSDFFGSGNNDIFVRTSTDQIDVWEYTTAGVAVEGQQLTVAGQPFLLDGGSTIVGTSQNFWGTGGSDIFIRSASGAMSVWEFNSAGVATVAHALSGVTLDGTSRVIGTSVGVYAAGNVDLYTVNARSQVTVDEVNSSGALGETTTFWVGLGQTITAVGAGTIGAGSEQDIILQSAGQATAYALNGVLLNVRGVISTTQSDGSAITLGSNGADTLTAGSAATTLIGNGGSDTYDLASNFTQATIVNGVSGNPASGAMVFQSGSVGIDNLWFDRVNDLGALSATGPDLRVNVLGTNESVTINDWFSGGIHQALAEIEVSGSAQYLDTGLNALMSAMSAYEANNPSFNPATAASAITDPTVLSAVNAAWHS